MSTTQTPSEQAESNRSDGLNDFGEVGSVNEIPSSKNQKLMSGIPTE